MKLRNHQFSTPVRTSEEDKFSSKNVLVRNIGNKLLIKPNPPTKEAVKRAQFKDKTYQWSRSSDIRSRNKRVTK